MSSAEYFRFVQMLADELTRKEIKLPSFPDVVIKIREALEDGDCTAERVADVVSLEPVLMSRILAMANSAFYNPAGVKITNLRAAISRLGFNMVRNTAIAMAVEQLFQAEQQAAIRNHLKTLWKVSLRKAAMAEVLADQHAELDADGAFLAGLLNEIGKLYILTKAKEFPTLLTDEDSRRQILEEWNPQVGKSILENWEFPEDIVDTVAGDQTQRRSSKPTLHDVIVAACYLSLREAEAEVEEEFQPVVHKLGIDGPRYPPVYQRFEDKLESLTAALAG